MALQSAVTQHNYPIVADPRLTFECLQSIRLLHHGDLTTNKSYNVTLSGLTYLVLRLSLADKLGVEDYAR